MIRADCDSSMRAQGIYGVASMDEADEFESGRFASTVSDIEIMVEAAGIEPASANRLPLDLHA